MHQVEAQAGRDLAGGVRFGPRPLDLDIIFFGDMRLKHEKLEIPHMRCGLAGWVAMTGCKHGPPFTLMRAHGRVQSCNLIGP